MKFLCMLSLVVASSLVGAAQSQYPRLAIPRTVSINIAAPDKKEALVTISWPLNEREHEELDKLVDGYQQKSITLEQAQNTILNNFNMRMASVSVAQQKANSRLSNAQPTQSTYVSVTSTNT